MVMKITEIKLEKVYNLGNYESQRIGLSAQLEDNENELEAMAILKQKIELMRR
jgi:hypothetical protein